MTQCETNSLCATLIIERLVLCQALVRYSQLSELTLPIHVDNEDDVGVVDDDVSEERKLLRLDTPLFAVM